MTRILIGLDDTDRPGARNSTARLARRLGDIFSTRMTFVGTVGHILHEGVDATTNNKASCVVLDAEAPSLDALLAEAADFIRAEAAPGASPGLVVATGASPEMIAFGRRTSAEPVSLAEARDLAAQLPHWTGGASEGLIGALAAIGLTAAGWSGRWLEWRGALRAAERALTVTQLAELGIGVVSIETDAEVPKPDEWVDTKDWLRPQLLGGRAMLPLRRAAGGEGWETVGVKKASLFR